MKKFFAFMLVMLLAFCMVACGGSEPDANQPDTEKETINETTEKNNEEKEDETPTGPVTVALERENLDTMEMVNLNITYDSEMFAYDGEWLLYTLDGVEPGLEIFIEEWLWPLSVFGTMEYNYKIDEELKDTELDYLLYAAIDNAYQNGDIDLEGIPEIIKTDINGMPFRYIQYKNIVNGDNIIAFVLETKDGYYIEGDGGILCENLEDFDTESYFGKLFMEVTVE